MELNQPLKNLKKDWNQKIWSKRVNNNKAIKNRKESQLDAMLKKLFREESHTWSQTKKKCPMTKSTKIRLTILKGIVLRPNVSWQAQKAKGEIGTDRLRTTWNRMFITQSNKSQRLHSAPKFTITSPTTTTSNWENPSRKKYCLPHQSFKCQKNRQIWLKLYKRSISTISRKNLRNR